MRWSSRSAGEGVDDVMALPLTDAQPAKAGEDRDEREDETSYPLICWRASARVRIAQAISGS